MPELPDITIYVEALRHRVVGAKLVGVSIKGPFLLRSIEPPVEATLDLRCVRVDRLGKRIVFGFEHERSFVLHLMIAGRLLWKPPGVKPRSKIDAAAFEFEAGATGISGTLLLTEASQKKRAALYVVQGRAALAEHDRGGLDPLAASLRAFSDALTTTNRTLKRALTDPRAFSGIGNAYSDEILHAARLSPIRLTSKLAPEEVERVHRATRETLEKWTARLRLEFGLDRPPGVFPGPGDITAFRPDFAVHGKFGKPCPVCGDPVQRIVHAENEINYCATCQTDGKVLADRSLSRLLKDDWPRTIEEWEAL